ncbi:MAG: DUF3034 family protein [Pseudohongiellaceae bacterium]
MNRCPSRQTRTGGMMLPGLLLGLLLTLPSPPAFSEGRLAGTGGVSSINGSGGGGLTGWATLAGYADTGETSGTVYASRADVDDFRLDVFGASATFSNRLEIGLARQHFTIKAADARIEQDRFTAKWRMAGDLIYGKLPQLSLGVEHGRLRDTGTALALGAADTQDTDYIISAARAWIDGLFHRTTLLNVNLRRSQANQYGILGFGGDDPGREWHAEGALAWFATRNIAIGAEYRQKPDNLSALREQSARDLFLAWFPNKRVSVTAAWLDLGAIAGQSDQTGFYLSLQAAF